MKVETLTPVERLQLANQFAILEKLDGSNAEYHAKNRKILQEGFTVLYSEVFQEIGEEISVDTCRYVFDVLDMHWALQQSFEGLADKEGLTLEDVRFEGFDGNNESEHYAFIKYLKEEGERWADILEGCGMNTHSQTAHRYGRMLAEWRALGDERHSLTAAQIKAIVNG